jgi:hypothetical protein
MIPLSIDRWLRGALSCALAVAMAAGLALAATPAAAAAPAPQPAVKVDYYPHPDYDPLTRLELEWRVANGFLSPNRNIGVFFVDITGMKPEDVNLLKQGLNPNQLEQLTANVNSGRVLGEYGLNPDGLNPFRGGIGDENYFALYADREDFQKRLFQRMQLDAWAAAHGRGSEVQLLKYVIPSDSEVKNREGHSEARDVRFLKQHQQVLAGRVLGLPWNSERQPCSKCAALTAQLPNGSYASTYNEEDKITARDDLADAFSAISPPKGIDPMTGPLPMRAMAVVKTEAAVAKERRAGAAQVGCADPNGSPKSGSRGGAPAGVVVPAFAAGAGPCGEDSANGPLVQALSQPASARPGGIDLSSLQLRYVSDTEATNGGGLRYAFEAPPATGPADPQAGLRVASDASNAFFVWLELPPSKFWVNLNPDQPDRIIDADLGRTDVGRVLLQADFQMKKTVARLIHPDTPAGAQFWQQLQSGPDGNVCLSMRQWIVPSTATVHASGNELYILDAPLSVKLESDYFKTRGATQQAGVSCRAQETSIEQHNEAVFRSVILPQVEKAVNEAPEYADLRRVYLSRIAAEWYRQRAASQPTTYSRLIDQEDIGPWVSKQSWNPKDIFNEYVQSYKNGEFNVTHQTQQGNKILTYTYVYGGVDFTRAPQHDVGDKAFLSQWKGLSRRVQGAMGQSTVEPDGSGVWLGGTSVSPSHQGEALAGTILGTARSLLLFWVFGMLAAIVVVPVVLLAQLRRRRA